MENVTLKLFDGEANNQGKNSALLGGRQSISTHNDTNTTALHKTNSANFEDKAGRTIANSTFRLTAKLIEHKKPK